MFTVRPYKKEDAAACGNCFYEGFFSCPVDQNDKILLCDYAQILIEKCNFTYVAEAEDHQVVGFWIYRCAESACPVFWKSPVWAEEITVPDR